MAARRPRAIVVGAGIVGASVAYHLARRGATVALYDRARPAGDVTAQAFAWINVSHGTPGPYSELRSLAVHEWRRLETELPGTGAVDWCGALSWTADPAATERFAREHAAWGYDVRLMDRDEVAAWEPNLVDPPALAAFAAGEGAVEPVAATEALVAGARDAGAEVLAGEAVLGLETEAGRVTGVRTAGGPRAADVVVVAAGVGAPALVEPLGVTLPVAPSPAILLRFRGGPARLTNTIVSSPGFEVRQDAEGGLLAAEDYVDGSAENGPQAVAERALAAIRAGWRGGGGLALEEVAVGWRPMPADELPVVGFAPDIEGLYVTAMHAGITLAPAVGRLATAEILDEVSVRMLETCRPARFREAA